MSLSKHQLSLAESMALAVLKGDEVAAYALADKLVEELGGRPSLHEVMKIVKKGYPGRLSVDGCELTNWPEWIDLCARLGVKWDLPTTKLVLTITPDESMTVEQTYYARDMKEQS